MNRRELAALPREELHRSRNWSKADVYAVMLEDGTRGVVKDLRRCPLWFRLLAGRRFLRREARALEALHGMNGVPRLLAQPDDDALVMVRHEGTPARAFKKRTLPREALLRLNEIVSQLHARGWTHGDLHPSNVLVGNGEVTLLDWATAHDWGVAPTGHKALLFREWRDLDRRQVAKLKAKHAPDLLSPDERTLLTRGGSRLYRALTTLRDWRGRLKGKKARPPSQIAARWERKLDAVSSESRVEETPLK